MTTRNTKFPPMPECVREAQMTLTVTGEAHEKLKKMMTNDRDMVRQGKAPMRKLKNGFESPVGFENSKGSSNPNEPTPLAGLPMHIADAALREISITTGFATSHPDNAIRQAVERAINDAYRHGLREGTETGALMTETAEELAERRMQHLSHIATVASMWANEKPTLVIEKDDVQIASWIVGARMYSLTIDGDRMQYSLDFDKITKGYKQYTENKG